MSLLGLSLSLFTVIKFYLSQHVILDFGFEICIRVRARAATANLKCSVDRDRDRERRCNKMLRDNAKSFTKQNTVPVSRTRVLALQPSLACGHFGSE